MYRTGRLLVGLVVAGTLLAGCTSTPSGTPGTGAGGGAGVVTNTTPPATDAALSITPSASGTVSPADPIVVKATNGTLTGVTVTDTAKGTHLAGTLSADRATWTSDQLAYGTTYRISAVGENSAGKQTTRSATVRTLTPARTMYANMVPAPTSVTSIGIGQPVVFQFRHAVTNKKAVQDALTVTTSPSQPGAWYWISSNEVHYRARTFWQPGTTISVTAKILGVDMGDGIYGAENRHVTYKVHDAWVAKADGHTHRMGIYHNGSLVKTMNISMGRASLPTHSGIHVISQRSQSVQMNSCSYGVCSGPNSYNETEYWDERISNSGEFVHENPATVGVQGSANVSHGCINLDEADAKWFFNHFNIGDVVEVTNSGGPPMPLSDLYGDWEVNWSTWQAGNA